MHVKENTSLSSPGDVEIKDPVEESESITSVSQSGSITTVTSSSPCTSSHADSVSDSVSLVQDVTECIPDSVHLPLGVGDCIRLSSFVSDDISRRLASSSVESNSLAQSVTLTESVSSGPSVSESVCSVQSVAECVVAPRSVVSVNQCSTLSSNNSNASISVSSQLFHSMSVDPLDGSDSAMETDDDSSEDEMVIDTKDIKQEVDSEAEDEKQRKEFGDTVDGTVLHSLHNISLKQEEDSSSSCSLINTLSFRNQESDASMRQRLLNSLSQSFPDSALSRVMHSMDTMPLDSEDEDLVPSADRLSSSCFSSIRLDKEDDDDLTNLAWLQELDLLKNINADLDPLSDEQKENTDSQKNGESGAGSFVPQAHPHHVPYNPMKHINSKPPYSFSCLIFMAVENAPGKKLPVKEIYNWILTNFPYFRNAPTGWKNSVRHNLSLNKCFKKVEKDKGANIGKGSLWCIDPDHRPNLLQMLRKTSYHPYQQLQMMSAVMPQQQQVHHIQGLPANAFRPMPLTQRSVPNTVSPHLFPFLSRRLAQTSVGAYGEIIQQADATKQVSNNAQNLEMHKYDRETHDVANVLLAMSSKNSSGRSTDGSEASAPTSPDSKNKRKFYGPPKRQGPFIITPNPSTEHSYSSPKILEEDAASGTSSIDNEYDFGDDDDISEPSDYPSDWDETSGDEVDGDVPQEWLRKRPKLDQSIDNNNGEEMKDEDQEGARLLMSFAGLATYSDEEEDRCPVKSLSSSCANARASSLSVAKPRRSASASPSMMLTKNRSFTAASKASSLSSSQSSASSSRSSTTKSAKPVSRSALKSKVYSNTTPAKSASTSSGKSACAATKTSKNVGSSASKSSGASLSSFSSSVKMAASKSGLSPASSTSSLKMSASKSSRGGSPSSSSSSLRMSSKSSSPSSSSSLKKSDLTTPSPAKQVVVSTSESPTKSSNAYKPSTVKSSIIMTRRGKAAAAEAAAEAAKTAAAEEAKTAVEEAAKSASNSPAEAMVPAAPRAAGAVHSMRTRGKKLSFL